MRPVSRDSARAALEAAQTHQHIGIMSSSARLAAEDAAACLEAGDFDHAYDRARESLLYSLGAFSAVVAGLPSRRV